MTIKQTLTLIRALNIKVVYRAEFQEFEVGKNGGYFTDDRFDAVYTAIEMAVWNRGRRVEIK